MSDGTEISWSDATLNIMSGCERVSPACDHCYIERTPPLRMAHRRFDKPGVGGAIPVQLHPERLAQLAKWRKPRRIFMPSLGDLFHDDVPDDFLIATFDAVLNSPQHTYQILTKRPARMRSFVNRYVTGEYGRVGGYPVGALPPNVWLGCTVEDHQWTSRLSILRKVPAQVLFISAEPLLSHVDLTPHLYFLAWVITGGETGPGARPTHPDWFRSVRDQCVAAGVPFHFKQWGDWAPITEGGTKVRDVCLSVDGGRYDVDRDYVCAPNESDGAWLRRVGKKVAGRELDGREWNEFPSG